GRGAARARARAPPVAAPHPAAARAARPQAGGARVLMKARRKSAATSAWSRVIVENIRPSVDGGRFAIKRVVGERVEVEADCFAAGHDAITVTLRWHHESDKAWRDIPMAPLGNDAWQAGFDVDREGTWRYAIEAAIDPLASWSEAFARRA